MVHDNNPTGGGDGVDGNKGGGDLCIPPPEHSSTIHFYQAHYVPVSVGGSTPGKKGWLIIISPIVGWYIMGCEPETLTAYNDIRNRSYHFALINTQNPSTHQLHGTHPDPIISAS